METVGEWGPTAVPALGGAVPRAPQYQQRPDDQHLCEAGPSDRSPFLAPGHAHPRTQTPRITNQALRTLSQTPGTGTWWCLGNACPLTPPPQGWGTAVPVAPEPRAGALGSPKGWLTPVRGGDSSPAPAIRGHLLAAWSRGPLPDFSSLPALAVLPAKGSPSVLPLSPQAGVGQSQSVCGRKRPALPGPLAPRV